MNHTDPPRWVTALAIALFIAAVVGCGFVSDSVWAGWVC